MASATIRKITVQDYIDGAGGEDNTYIQTHSGRYKVTYIRNPRTDPWVVCGTGLDQTSWCVHGGTELEVEESTAADAGTCPACSGDAGDATEIAGVYHCQRCGGIFGTCTGAEGLKLVRPAWATKADQPGADDRAIYYDLTITPDTIAGIPGSRRHGWYDPKTRKITQTG